MNKSQATLFVANGFLGALGHRGITAFDKSKMRLNHDFDTAWRAWVADFTPSFRSEHFPNIGQQYPQTSLTDLLYRAERSRQRMAKGYSINDAPSGLDFDEFIEIHASEVALDDWLDLADLYLAEDAR